MGKDLKIQSGVPQATLDKEAWKVLLYGVSGAGKTRTASLWPKPLFMDFDHGLGSVSRKIAWVRMEKWADWTGWFDKLLTDRLPIQSIVIDSVPAMQRMAIESSVNRFSTKRAHGDIPGQSDYGKMFWDVWRSIDQLLDLPYHKILIAQCTLGDFGEAHRPAFEGKAIVEPILQAMDLIGYVDRSGKDVTLSFDRADAITKDRFGLFSGTVFKNPTWAQIEGRLRKTTKQELPEIQEGKPAG